MREIDENLQATESVCAPAETMSRDERDAPAAEKEVSSQGDKKLIRKLLMIPIVVGIVVAGAAFGLPLVFSTKKEPREVTPESAPPVREPNGEKQ